LQKVAGRASGAESEEDDPLLRNPNHVSAKPKKLSEVATTELSRREREAVEAEQAQERFWKLHEQGKTEKARADLERLALVRKEREMRARAKAAEKASEAAGKPETKAKK
jgi:hypothetical protein